jgi:hypothetical protein
MIERLPSNEHRDARVDRGEGKTYRKYFDISVVLFMVCPVLLIWLVVDLTIYTYSQHYPSH